MSEKKSNNKQTPDIVEECVELLKTNKNIILNGAPGTGKTYLAKQIAAKMIGKEYKGESTDNDPIFKERVRLVQFHPSYDYTDFVEGLRPISADGQIGFKRKDGVFKAFCKSTDTDSILSNINGLIGKQLTTRGKGIFNIKSIEDNKVVIRRGTYTYKLDANIIALAIWKKFKNLDFGKFEDCVAKRQTFYGNFYDMERPKMISPYYKAVYDYLLKNYTNDKEKVFIIDEINRGEISKIFGELFFSIDPGYRGIKGRVDTQYQNLITDDNDCFKDGFYVPENVYIIGTMNDIDRSVESMDFAFRRRFAFREVQASDTQYMLSELGQDVKKDQDVKKRMTDLNKAIEKAGFTSAYHVGASYFLKLKESGYDVGKLWDYHLEGLLKEYLRGREDAEKILNDWKHAYGLKNGK